MSLCFCFVLFVPVSRHSSVPSWESWAKRAAWSKSEGSWRTRLSSPGSFPVRFEATSCSGKRSTLRSTIEFWEPAPWREWESLSSQILDYICFRLILSIKCCVERLDYHLSIRVAFGSCSGFGHVTRWRFGNGRGQRGQSQRRPEGESQPSKVWRRTLQSYLLSLLSWGR